MSRPEPVRTSGPPASIAPDASPRVARNLTGRVEAGTGLVLVLAALGALLALQLKREWMSAANLGTAVGAGAIGLVTALMGARRLCNGEAIQRDLQHGGRAWKAVKDAVVASLRERETQAFAALWGQIDYIQEERLPDYQAQPMALLELLLPLLEAEDHRQKAEGEIRLLIASTLWSGLREAVQELQPELVPQPQPPQGVGLAAIGLLALLGAIGIRIAASTGMPAAVGGLLGAVGAAGAFATSLGAHRVWTRRKVRAELIGPIQRCIQGQWGSLQPLFTGPVKSIIQSAEENLKQEVAALMANLERQL